MITSLTIENFALIDKLSIDFSDGFSIITGETGAGKSILLGALGLVLGKRADLSALKNKELKCIVEAHFQISNYDLEEFFTENDLEYEGDTIIRREILPSGKSRAFINDSPVNVALLQELGSFLIDVHSQQQTQELSEENFQFKILDSLASNQELLQLFKSELKLYKSSQKQLSSLQNQLQSINSEQDYNNFLLDELVAANLKVGEQSELEEAFEQLNNVESIRENIDKILAYGTSEEIGILQNLKEVRQSMQRLSGFSSVFQSLFDRLDSSIIEIDDIFSETASAGENVNLDPEELERIGQRLQMIYSLQKKHHVDSVEGLLEIQDKLERQGLSVNTLEDQIANGELAVEKSKSVLNDLGLKIHEKRMAAAPILSKKIIDILLLLGMPNVRFKLEITNGDNFFENGKDEIQFFVSVNKGSDFGLLKKVASGGEMSRIMLAVKSILAQYSKLPTIIFDEIDTGVSGEIANKMGDIMKSMSKDMQVFSITHLPQIAAKGNTHYKVFKSDDGQQTTSELKLLTKDERVREIAQMLSGSSISDSAINHAKALLD